MAQCAGCTGGLNEVAHSNTNCIHLTGTGTTLDPLIATLQIDPASPSTITCGPSGLSVAGGGGGLCSQKLFYSVASVGPAGFGGVLGTPEPFQSCADFIGDGVNDAVALQAAINASAADATGTVMTVFINPGFYFLTSSVDPKGVSLQGGNLEYTALTNDIFLGGLGGNRLIDGSVSGKSMTFEKLTFYAGGAAAIYQAPATIGGLHLDNCRVFLGGSDSGADGAFVSLTQFGYSSITNCQFSTTTNSGIHDSIRLTNSQAPGNQITNNQFLGAGIRLEDVSYTRVTDNTLSNIYTAGTVGKPIYAIGLFNFSHHNEISNNILSTLYREGIVLNGTAGGASVSNNQIMNNQVSGYAFDGSVTEDGIHLSGIANENNIQGNAVRVAIVTGRHGINIEGAGCSDNFVTNNDLFNSGTGTSLADTGTATITAAGNRL